MYHIANLTSNSHNKTSLMESYIQDIWTILLKGIRNHSIILYTEHRSPQEILNIKPKSNFEPLRGPNNCPGTTV